MENPSVKPPTERTRPAPGALLSAPVSLRLAPGEAWCAKCGETCDRATGYCTRCGARRTVPAAQILRRERDEYYIAT